MTATNIPELSQERRQRIPSLDGLRAVSIALVLLGHVSNTVPAMMASDSLHRFFESCARLGVAIFFVISGYIITTLLLREADTTGKIHLGRFYLRRAVRIWPAFYVFLIVLAVISAMGYHLINVREFFASALFVWNYANDGNWWVGHSWSLAVEEQFYLLWPALLLLAGRKKCVPLAAGLIAVCPLIRIACYVAFPDQRGGIEFWFHTRMDSLMFGCLLALIGDSAWFHRIAKGFALIGGPWLASIFVLAISPWLGGRFRELYNVPIRYTLEGAAIVLVMDWLVRRPNSPAGRFLNSRWVIHIGLISYSLYLWQQPFLNYQPTTAVQRAPLNLICAFACAEISYWVVERSFQGLRKKLRA